MLEDKIPNTLEEGFLILKENLKLEDLELFKNNPEETAALAHFSLGMFLRNEWKLWFDSNLAKWFHEKGILHADDMSGIILLSFGRWLNNYDIKLEEQIKHCQAYYKQY